MANEYFLDVYGHIYRWEQTSEGKQSVPVANWQRSGSHKECSSLLAKANAYQKLTDALRGKYPGTFEQLLRELGESA